VQFSALNKPVPEEKINPTPPPAQGVQVRWQKGHGLPQTHGHGPRSRPRALEAVSDETLTMQEFEGGYRVDLPDFQFMALLVVTAPGSPPGHQQASA
jgi:hypothetical protein